MSTPKFAETHNLVASLEKSTKFEGFEQIIDFLNANPIEYVLTVNPTIYTSCIKQFWATTNVKTINGEQQIQALVDKIKVIITETSVRSDLHLKDAEGTECLPTATIFEQLTLMGQVEEMLKHKEIYVTPSHTKKIFANMKRQEKDFFAKVIPLFETTMVQPQEDMDEHVTTTFNDPLLSGEDRLKLTELMELCTQLQSRVLALETTKADQALEGRVIEDLDADEGVALVDETQGRNDQDMFNTSILDDEEVVAEKKVSTADLVSTVGEVVTTIGVKVKGSEKEAEGSSKRATGELEQEDAKRQRIEEENESAELKRCLEIILDDNDDVTIEATPYLLNLQPLLIIRSTKKGGKLFQNHQSRLKPEPIIDVKIHPNAKPAVLSMYRNNDKRNFEVHNPFKFRDFEIMELDELGLTIKKKKNSIVKDLMTFLGKRYERLKNIPKQLGIQSVLPASVLGKVASQSSRRKRKHMDLEPKVKVPRLECNRSLSDGIPFVNNMVIKAPEYGIFFADVFGDQAFQRWNDIHKVRVDSLVSYLVMASMVKTQHNARFGLKLRKLIAKHYDQEKLQSKKMKLDALG
uniref:Xylulose kinase-1 n=1 Tax=Tanacetum cinerariifolium TaxID=118510 RepID=A0A6L2N6S4_TANCI|nr:xylulose kinase-1 [Tanacetum cinerariifolium]